MHSEAHAIVLQIVLGRPATNSTGLLALAILRLLSFVSDLRGEENACL